MNFFKYPKKPAIPRVQTFKKPVPKVVPKKPGKITYKDFAREIQNDLAYLQTEFYEGIYILDLKGYYGETVERIRHALSVLEQEQIVEIRQAPNNYYYVVVCGQEPPAFVELTPIQRKVVRYIIDLCKRHGTTRLQSDYSQLSRIMKMSMGGLSSTVKRLTELEYLTIENSARAGFTGSLILAVGPKSLKAYEDYHLDT